MNKRKTVNKGKTVKEQYNRGRSRLRVIWEKHWEIIVVAILAVILAEFVLPMFLK